MPSDVVRWGLRPPRPRRGGAALAAGYAVAQVGAAALGALAEKPELFGRVLVLVGLAEGIAIYGLIVSILILNRLRLDGGASSTSADEATAAGYRLAGLRRCAGSDRRRRGGAVDARPRKARS